MIGLASALGTPISKAAAATCPPTTQEAYVSYFNWFDNASPGMVADNIHIVNTGTGPFSGCVTVGTQSVPFGAGPGQETYVTLPPGTIGGPVKVSLTAWLAGTAYSATQRVEYYQSFNAQLTGGPATTSYFNWYDKASPGMINDNIHLFNPGTSSANVTVSVPGALPKNITVAAGVETYVTFPAGTIGGPVTVSSTQPVMASQRVQFNQSFNEEWAYSQAQATKTSYFSWYDNASTGFANDNIHLLNPGVTTANVTVSLPGAAPKTVSVPQGQETYVNFKGMIGGPVLVSSDQPVLAAQRVQFYSSFNSIWSYDASLGRTMWWINWYDKASAGMNQDNIHVINPGTVDASVTVTLMLTGGFTPSQTVTVPAGAERYVTLGAYIGGPVKVTVNSGPAVIASQRVQYYRSFNEVWAG
jgi:hypothetical protein